LRGAGRKTPIFWCGNKGALLKGPSAYRFLIEPEIGAAVSSL